MRLRILSFVEDVGHLRQRQRDLLVRQRDDLDGLALERERFAVEERAIDQLNVGVFGREFLLGRRGELKLHGFGQWSGHVAGSGLQHDALIVDGDQVAGELLALEGVKFRGRQN